MSIDITAAVPDYSLLSLVGAFVATAVFLFVITHPHQDPLDAVASGGSFNMDSSLPQLKGLQRYSSYHRQRVTVKLPSSASSSSGSSTGSTGSSRSGSMDRL